MNLVQENLGGTRHLLVRRTPKFEFERTWTRVINQMSRAQFPKRPVFMLNVSVELYIH
jgi:hypothetical protein